MRREEPSSDLAFEVTDDAFGSVSPEMNLCLWSAPIRALYLRWSSSTRATILVGSRTSFTFRPYPHAGSVSYVRAQCAVRARCPRSGRPSFPPSLIPSVSRGSLAVSRKSRMLHGSSHKRSAPACGQDARGPGVGETALSSRWKRELRARPAPALQGGVIGISSRE